MIQYAALIASYYAWSGTGRHAHYATRRHATALELIIADFLRAEAVEQQARDMLTLLDTNAA